MDSTTPATGEAADLRERTHHATLEAAMHAPWPQAAYALLLGLSRHVGLGPTFRSWAAQLAARYRAEYAALDEASSPQPTRTESPEVATKKSAFRKRTQQLLQQRFSATWEYGNQSDTSTAHAERRLLLELARELGFELDTRVPRLRTP